jgi:uncharacterized protein YjbI with pentapeptide repeats/uncharacterized RDD family membrane protein YckC
MVQPATANTHKMSLETIDVVPESTSTVQQRLLWRRFGAWLAEVGLVVVSGLVPVGLGSVVDGQLVQKVPLNPVLNTTQTFIARGIKPPRQWLVTEVAPLTNMLWSVGLFLPMVVVGTQVYQLAHTGQNLPKRWFKLRLIAFQGASLRPRQVLLRELGRWGLPLGVACSLGLLSGASLVGLWFPAGVGLCLLGVGATALLNVDRRACYDGWAGTWLVGTQADEITQTYHVAAEDIADQTPESPRGYPQLNGVDLEDVLSSLNDQTAMVLTEVDSGLTSIILAPQRTRLPMHLPHWRTPKLLWGSALLGGLMVLGGAMASGQLYWQRQRPERNPQVQSDRQFLATANTLIATSKQSAEYQAAILALAQVSDPRALQFLGDLLTQTNDPKILSALQQALTSQGVSGFPVLQTLSQTLSSDLAMVQDEVERTALLKRQQIVKRAIAKLLILHDGELMGIDLNKVDLGQTTDDRAPFHLQVSDLKAAGTQWRGALLTAAQLQNSQFFDPGADGQAGTYDDLISDLSGADLTEADLSHTQFHSAQLVNTSLLRANLSQSQLAQANLTGSNLTSAVLIEATGNGSRFADSNLVGADLTQANFEQADFTGARLTRTEAAESVWIGANLQETDWLEANLSAANLSQADLTQANLQGVNLKGADLSGAQLTMVNLSQADLTGVILTGANLTGVDFQGARFSPAGDPTVDSFITTAPTLNDAANALKNVDFSRAINLSPRQLTYICAQGAIHPACPED